MTRSWPAVLGALMRGESLPAADTAWAMDEIMRGEASPAQLAAFVVLLRAKGETTDELTGLVEAMLGRATRVTVPGRVVDIVGTGGDLAHTVNITTMAALVVAGSGRRVVKHGNRSASSQCGTADVLEELGVVIDLGAAGVAATVAEVGIGFCFAPVFHPGMRHAGPPRREIGVPTAFNVLGPLTNPAQPPASAVGCADRRMAPLMAAVFARRGQAALVFRGDDGLDELTTTTTSSMWVATGGAVHETSVDPRSFGLAIATTDELRGGDPPYNAGVARDILAGRANGARDAVLLNAGAAIAIHDGLDGLDGAGAANGAGGVRGVEAVVDAAIAKGIDEARRTIDSGAAAQLLDRWVTASQRLKAG